MMSTRDLMLLLYNKIMKSNLKCCQKETITYGGYNGMLHNEYNVRCYSKIKFSWININKQSKKYLGTKCQGFQKILMEGWCDME